jgi:hypothetical protein
MRFVTFVKRCNTPTLIRCLMEAFEYFGGLTKIALTDRMKSVLLEMQENKPRWNPRLADFMVSIGVAARVCKSYTPQTKGKVERTVSHVKKSRLRRCHVHQPRRSQSPGPWLVRAHQWPCPSHDAHTPAGAVSPGEPVALATRLCLGALCDRRTQSDLGWLRLLRWGALWLARQAGTGRQIRSGG